MLSDLNIFWSLQLREGAISAVNICLSFHHYGSWRADIFYETVSRLIELLSQVLSTSRDILLLNAVQVSRFQYISFLV